MASLLRHMLRERLFTCSGVCTYPWDGSGLCNSEMLLLSVVLFVTPSDPSQGGDLQQWEGKEKSRALAQRHNIACFPRRFTLRD